jgi:hypothetical protein
VVQEFYPSNTEISQIDKLYVAIHNSAMLTMDNFTRNQ